MAFSIFWHCYVEIIYETFVWRRDVFVTIVIMICLNCQYFIIIHYLSQDGKYIVVHMNIVTVKYYKHNCVK